MTKLTEEAERIAAETPPLATGHALLRAQFPASQVGKLPRAGIELDYVGHGAVRSRLLEVDPSWTWEPFSVDADGQPKFTLDANGNPIAFWIRLTVLDVTRPGVGTCPGNQFDAEKVLIGDALRNAAMSFGVALDLWIRGHAEDDEKVSASNRAAPPRQAPPPDPALVARDAAARQIKALPDTQRAAVKAFCEANGLPKVPAEWDDAQLAAILSHVASLEAPDTGLSGPESAPTLPMGGAGPSPLDNVDPAVVEAAIFAVKALTLMDVEDQLAAVDKPVTGVEATDRATLAEHYSLHGVPERAPA